MFNIYDRSLLTSHPANCLANPDFKPVASGGDGEFVQYCKHLCFASVFLVDFK